MGRPPPRRAGPLAARRSGGHNGWGVPTSCEAAALKFSRDQGPGAVGTAPAPGRWRRRLLRLGIPLVLAAAAVIGWAISATSGLSSAVRDADRLDPGWRLEELEAKRAVYPDAENAAAVIARLK